MNDSLLNNKKGKGCGSLMGRLDGLNSFAMDIHQNAIEHGFWTPPYSFGEIIALCHSELSEALESYRNNEPLAFVKGTFDGNESQRLETDINKWEHQKPEGMAVEMADCIIRILDWCAANNVDIEALLIAKHQYNTRREYKHGGKLL